MKKYTVLLMYPDYISNDYGKETYQAFAAGAGVEDAIKEARQDCISDNAGAEFDSPEDLSVLAVYEGHQLDVSP